MRNLILFFRVIYYFKNKPRKRIPSIHLEELSLTYETADDTMRTNLLINKETLQELYKPRLDTLQEEDEIMESSYKTPSIWKGRAKQY